MSKKNVSDIQLEGGVVVGYEIVGYKGGLSSGMGSRKRWRLEYRTYVVGVEEADV